MNSHISGMRSSESIRLRWMWHTVTEFRRVSVIVVWSHVLSLRRALKLRSASADEAEETSRSRTRMQTVSNNPRTSGSICRNSVTASPTTSILLPLRNILNSNFKSLILISGWVSSNSSSLSSMWPVMRMFSSLEYFLSPALFSKRSSSLVY